MISAAETKSWSDDESRQRCTRCWPAAAATWSRIATGSTVRTCDLDEWKDETVENPSTIKRSSTGYAVRSWAPWAKGYSASWWATSFTRCRHLEAHRRGGRGRPPRYVRKSMTRSWTKISGCPCGRPLAWERLMLQKHDVGTTRSTRRCATRSARRTRLFRRTPSRSTTAAR